MIFASHVEVSAEFPQSIEQCRESHPFMEWWYSIQCCKDTSLLSQSNASHKLISATII